jgi:hypothetical protein
MSQGLSINPFFFFLKFLGGDIIPSKFLNEIFGNESILGHFNC